MLFHEIPWQIKTVTGPAIEPVSVDELKLQLRVDPGSNDENALLQDLIAAARELVEIDTRRALISQQLALYMDQFPYWGQLDRQSIERTSQMVGVFYGGGIEVHRPPVLSIDSLQYLNTNGVLTTFDPAQYITDTVTEPTRIYPAYAVPWPITRWQANAVVVTFTAGYGTDPTSVPARARQAIKMLAAHWFWHRESVGQVGDEIAQGYQRCITSLKWGG